MEIWNSKSGKRDGATTWPKGGPGCRKQEPWSCETGERNGVKCNGAMKHMKRPKEQAFWTVEGARSRKWKSGTPNQVSVMVPHIDQCPASQRKEQFSYIPAPCPQ